LINNLISKRKVIILSAYTRDNIFNISNGCKNEIIIAKISSPRQYGARSASVALIILIMTDGKAFVAPDPLLSKT